MKPLLVLAACALAMRGRVGSPSEPQEPSPFLAEPAGPVHFMPPGTDVWLVAKSSRTLEVGTRLRTGKKASAVIVTGRGSARLQAEASAKLDTPRAVYVGGGSARYEGRLGGRFPVASAEPSVPSVFEVTVSSGGDTLVRVSSGTVAVKDNGGQEHVLTAGSKERWFTASSSRTQPPPEPLEPPAQPLP